MTNKEAIEHIKNGARCNGDCEYCEKCTEVKYRQALNLAIKALEERPQGEWIKDMDQYYFDRDSFVECFKSVFSDDEIFMLESACQEHKLLGDFLLYYTDDEFYIIHLSSGIMINWYKHLGRTNTCNKEDFTFNELKELLQMLKSEGKEE